MDAFGGRGEVLHHSTHYRPLWINSYFPNKLSVRITITVPEKYARCFIYSFNLPNNSGKPVFVFPSQRKNKALKSTLLQILQRFLVCVFGEEERMSPSPSSNTACPLWSYLDGRRLQISFIFQRVTPRESLQDTALHFTALHGLGRDPGSGAPPLEADTPGLISLLYPNLVLCPWASYLTSLSIMFLTCAVEMIVESTSKGCRENWMRKCTCNVWIVLHKE